jgi:hypothetical protein
MPANDNPSLSLLEALSRPTVDACGDDRGEGQNGNEDEGEELHG